MNICVCVKQVPSANEQRLDPVTGTVIREGVSSILNPFDAYAVEEAVRLKAKFGGQIAAVSMGVPSAVETLRRIVAVGVDRAILLTDRAFAGADTLATARALALGIQKIGNVDLILCGRMATDGDTAQVGPMLAELLGIPHATDVSKIGAAGPEFIEVARMADDGYLRARLPLPALLTVVKEINVPKLPSVAGVLRGRRAGVDVWSASDIGADPGEIGLRGSRTRVVKTARPEPRAACRFLSGAGELLEVLKGGGRA
jgi:electron transfer flavoprotein beta subunit